MKRYLLPFILIAASLLAGCSPGLRGRSDRAKYIENTAEEYLHSIYLRGASWSILAVDLQTGKVLLNRDAERSLIPASNMKLLTTACALETLGPDYRFETTIGCTGDLDYNGTLHGNLIVIGTGDPTIGSRYSWLPEPPDFYNPGFLFSRWADSLRSIGIDSIAGDILGYGGYFSNYRHGSGWEWNDLDYWFASEIDPLIYADGAIEITVTPAQTPGQPATIAWQPQYVGGPEIQGHILTSEAEASRAVSVERSTEANLIYIGGTIPANDTPYILKVSVRNLQNYYLTAFAEALRTAGIKTGGLTVSTHADWLSSGNMQVLIEHDSTPLKNIVRIINRDSQNLYAESLLRAIGMEALKSDTVGFFSDQDAYKTGRETVRLWNSRINSPSTGYVMVDGSGLSRRNVLSATAVVRVLAHMSRSKYRNEYINSMATPGTGTLQYRFQAVPDQVFLHAKTGSATRVRALSGYLSTPSGPRVAFSMICNNYLCESREVEAALDNLCQLLALYVKGR